ncbi:MAG TPA: AI-2E family transporter [Pyrinomonadaceae bacterium]|nr:AI-2E family transporter [Pyrinomonadaceae bacterium]
MKFRREKKEEPIRETAKEVATAIEAAKEVATASVEASTSVVILETWPQKRVIMRVIIITLLVAALLWVLYRLQGVILLIVLSIFFAYLVAPLVELVRRPFKVRSRERIMPRPIAIGIVYLVLFAALAIALWVLLPRLSKQIKAFSAASTQFQTTAEGRVKALNDFCRSHEISDNACDAINNTLTRAITSAKTYIAEDLPGLVVGVLSYLPWLILIPILSFFLLNDADDFRRSALQMLPRGRWRWRGDEFFQDVNSTLAAYIRAQLTACLLIGVICTLGFVVLGVPFPLVLGVLAGLLEFIPLVGPLVVGIIAALVTSFSPDTTTSAIWVVLFLGVLRVVHDYAIYPRLVSHGIHLHPLAVILAILSGAELAGIAGIFLAIPVIAIATVSYRHWLEHRGSEGLMADILQPVDEIMAVPVSDDELLVALPHSAYDAEEHPTADTTPEQMVRARPDLTTGELKLPKMD